MAIKIEKENFAISADLTETGRIAISLAGRFDHDNAPLLSQAVTELQAQINSDQAIVDFIVYLHALEFINSTAIKELLKLLSSTQENDGQLVLIGSEDNPAVQTLVEMGFNQIFSIYPTLVVAIQYFYSKTSK